MQATFPHLKLNQSVRFTLVGQSLDTETSISGADTVVRSMAARWQAQASFVIRGEGPVLEWQAFLAQMEGRIGTTMVPAYARWRGRDRDGHVLPACTVGGIAGAQTFEHFGFAGEDVRYMTVAEAAPLRATQITVDHINTTGLRPGQFFSIGDRLYRVQAEWFVGAGRQRIMIQPPLRANAVVGAQVELGRPVCRMRFASEDEGVFDQSLDVLPVVTVSFVEAV